jgi:hypothetical protein
MDNLNKINYQYEKENNLKTKDPKNSIDLNQYNIESFLLNHTTDEQESLRSIIYEDKKKKLKQYLWIYEQEFKENQKLKELKDYNEEFMKLPQNVKKKIFFNIK